MRNDMLVARGGGSVRCRICEFDFVPEEPRDRERHKEEHEKLARGGLPFGVREFLKAFGWDTAYNNSRNRVRNKQDREVGKLAIAYS